MQLTYYGTGHLMANILTALAYVLNSSDYYTLLQFVMVLAGVLIIKNWHQGHVRGGLGGVHLGIGSLVVLAMFYGGYAPKTDLVVYDPVTNYNVSVRHMPQGVALILWASNRLTDGFATLFDKAFTDSGFPSDFTYEQTGGFPKSLVYVGTSTKDLGGNTYLLLDLENYIHDCYYSAVLLGLKDNNELFTSGNLLNTLSTNLSDSYTTTYYPTTGGQGQNVSCTTAYNNIKNDINNATQTNGSAFKSYMQALMSAGAIESTTTTNTVSAELQAGANFLLGASLTSQELITQNVLINAINPSLQQFASQNGLNANTLSEAIAQSALNTQTSMVTSYALAQTFLPMSFLIINALIIAILPLLFAMMFVPALTRKYGIMAFDLFMWIAFWSPIASIVNYMVQSLAAQRLQATTALANHTITAGNIGPLIDNLHTLMAVAGDIMFSVPVLAFAIASGSAYAMTQVAGAVGGLSKGIATNASSRMSTYGSALAQDSMGHELESNAIESQGKFGGYKHNELGLGESMANNVINTTNAMTGAGMMMAVRSGTNIASESFGSGIGNGNSET